jgi:hypothetical protein
MNTKIPIASTKSHTLLGKWDLYYHLPQDKNWDINSYKLIVENIDTVEQAISVNEAIPEKIVKGCMLFAMRNGVKPRWEDPANCEGGCFSFKVANNSVNDVWKNLFYALCGDTLFKQSGHNNNVTGITISPKRSFCIVKVWLKDCSIQDPSTMTVVDNLSKEGCLFKKHAESTTFNKGITRR